MSTTPTQFAKAFGAWFAFCAVLGLGLTGGLVYAAVHFIAKFW